MLRKGLICYGGVYDAAVGANGKVYQRQAAGPGGRHHPLLPPQHQDPEPDPRRGGCPEGRAPGHMLITDVKNEVLKYLHLHPSSVR